MNVVVGERVWVKEHSYDPKTMECETRHVPATVIAVYSNKIGVRFNNGVLRELSGNWFRKSG